MDQGEKVSFKPALAQPGETNTSKNKTRYDHLASAIVSSTRTPQCAFNIVERDICKH